MHSIAIGSTLLDVPAICNHDRGWSENDSFRPPGSSPGGWHETNKIRIKERSIPAREKSVAFF